MPENRDRRKLLLGFVAINLITGTAAGILQMVVPLFAMSLNASNAQIGLIKGVNGLGFLLLVIPAGFLVDRFGSKRLYLAGSISCNLVALAVAMAAKPVALILLMGGYGFFRSLSFIATNAAFFRSLAAIGAERVGWLNGSLTLGFSFVGPLLGGYLANCVDFSRIVQMVAVLMPVPILLVLFYYHEAPRATAAAATSRETGSQLKEFGVLLRNRSIYRVLLAEGLGGACSGTFGVFIIVIVVRNLHLAPTVASALLTLQGAFFIMAVFFAGPLVKRLPTQNLYLASFTAASLGLIGLSGAGDLMVMGLAAMLLGVGLGLNQLLNYSRIGEIPGEKGKITSLLATAGSLGLAIGPLAAGKVGEYFGNQLIFAFFVPFFLLLGLMTWCNQWRNWGAAPVPVGELDALKEGDQR